MLHAYMSLTYIFYKSEMVPTTTRTPMAASITTVARVKPRTLLLPARLAPRRRLATLESNPSQHMQEPEQPVSLATETLV
jgi:hypothetical protein